MTKLVAMSAEADLQGQPVLMNHFSDLAARLSRRRVPRANGTARQQLQVSTALVKRAFKLQGFSETMLCENLGSLSEERLRELEEQFPNDLSSLVQGCAICPIGAGDKRETIEVLLIAGSMGGMTGISGGQTPQIKIVDGAKLADLEMRYTVAKARDQ